MARKHDMVTVFGDLYDHVTDVICFIWVIRIYIYQYALLENTLMCVIQ